MLVQKGSKALVRTPCEIWKSVQISPSQTFKYRPHRLPNFVLIKGMVKSFMHQLGRIRGRKDEILTIAREAARQSP